MNFLEKLSSSVEKNGEKIGKYIKETENRRENIFKEKREKLKELENEYNNIKAFKKFWLTYFIIIFVSTILLVPFVETIPLIIGMLGASVIGEIGVFIEINKEQKQKKLSEEIRNLKSELMWEPNEEIVEYCAKKNVEFILGRQKYSFPQLEKKEKESIENNNVNLIDNDVEVEKEKSKTYNHK